LPPEAQFEKPRACFVVFFAMDADAVKGMGQAVEQAEAGMKLFKEESVIEGDLEAATKFKEEIEAKMAKLEEESKALTGKENKKLRTEKDKEKAALKIQKDYIDACKVVKGLPPVHGHFVKSGGAKAAEPAAAAAPVAEEKKEETEKKEEKKEKPKKKEESAGISREERAELEGLKQKIIDKKAELKAQGMSGGQCNKDADVVAMVARMNELKEKESPGSTTAAKDDKGGKKKKVLDSDTQKMLEEKKRLFEEYAEKLRTEFKYSKKEIQADPEYQEMKAEIAKMEK